MEQSQHEKLVSYWLRALRSESGICIEVVPADRTMFMSQLYRARKAEQNPLLEKLCIVIVEKLDELWIVYKTV